MTPEEAIKIVQSKANLRTRYEGQEAYLDEVLVAEIERLTRAWHAEMETAAQMQRDRDEARRAAWEALRCSPGSACQSEFAQRYPWIDEVAE